MYLRTLCDRELYLSLFSNAPKALAAAGIPIPLKSRPGVQFITTSGVAFENEQYDILASALPNNVIHSESGKQPVPLKRTALCVIDLKNVTEANASYSAEVCLYAIFLSNWLHALGDDLTKRFFVSDRVYLWRHVEMPQFTKMKSTKEGMDHEKRLKPAKRPRMYDSSIVDFKSATRVSLAWGPSTLPLRPDIGHILVSDRSSSNHI